jgi:hypothetical protein
VHLGDAQAVRDRILTQPVPVVHPDDESLAWFQFGEHVGEHDPVLGRSETRVVDEQHVGRERLGVTTGLGERSGLVGGAGLHGLHDLLVGRPDRPGQFADRRRPSELGAEPFDRGVDGTVQVLHAPWHPEVPGPVTEVVFDLSDDRRSGEHVEGDAPFGVEPVDGVDETDGRHLEQVLERHAPVGEAFGESACEG